jgi:hypothetical protein
VYTPLTTYDTQNRVPGSETPRQGVTGGAIRHCRQHRQGFRTAPREPFHQPFHQLTTTLPTHICHRLSSSVYSEVVAPLSHPPLMPDPGHMDMPSQSDWCLRTRNSSPPGQFHLEVLPFTWRPPDCHARSMQSNRTNWWAKKISHEHRGHSPSSSASSLSSAKDLSPTMPDLKSAQHAVDWRMRWV